MKQNNKESKIIKKTKDHRISKFILFTLVFVILLFFLWWLFSKIQAKRFQDQLQPFYNTQQFPNQGLLGEVLRQEPLGAKTQNGTSTRFIYRTERFDGSKSFSSAMLFVPNKPSAEPMPIVAWAHGTIGMGKQCAPTRLNDPIANLPWIDQMLQKGWIVVATDYAGLGTDGTEGYLIGQSEAYDVINSVRATKNITKEISSNDYTVWGHSQGGHSALFTSKITADYAPELNLKATVASAPAAELLALFNQQFNTALGWVIGPEILVSWPSMYKDLKINKVATESAMRNYQKLAMECIDTSAIEGLVRNKLGESFFSTKLSSVAEWNNVAVEQTAPVPDSSIPLLVAQSESDQVVLPNTTSLYIQNACNAGSNLSSLWISGVGHIQTAEVIAPDVINWISDRFKGISNISNCNQTLPVSPAS